MKTKSVKVPTTKHMSTVVQTKSEHVRSAISNVTRLHPIVMSQMPPFVIALCL